MKVQDVQFLKDMPCLHKHFLKTDYISVVRKITLSSLYTFSAIKKPVKEIFLFEVSSINTSSLRKKLVHKPLM